MRSIKAIALSWTLWGLAYYLYSPYLTEFLKNIVNRDFVGFIYVLSSLVGILYSIMPLYTRRVKEITIISLMISGLGLILLSISYNEITAIIATVLFSAYWSSVPVFYLMMRDNVAKIWAISMLPALIIPFVGEGIVLTLGLKYVFAIAGVFMMLTALPIIKVEVENRGGKEKETKFNPSPLVFTIIPLSISLPYLYIDTPLTLVPLIYAIGEVIGILMAWYLSEREHGLSLALLGFSMIFTNSFAPYGAMFYGLSEALTAIGIDNVRINSLRDAVKVTITEISLWLVGFAVATVLFAISPMLPTIYASLLAILFSLMALLSLPLIRKVIVFVVYLNKDTSPKIRFFEGITPYFKFA